ncbi:SUKH-4 family immunity protein [Kitasatospora terrestris]|uniref:Nucleic acid/nucleotide deaminase of polymorphic system toxin n=1 Tax=Kitasatospora terrestris TaxID=258051 RepID=A0ABP9DS65_9ACTN
MITREQALAAAHRWVNGDLPQDTARPVRSFEFDLGWVVWPEPSPVQVDPLTGARRAPEEIGAACAVVDRASGELSVWPSVPVPEVVRVYRDRLGAGSHDPALPPVTGPGSRTELAYRDAAGEPQSLVVESAPGLPHPALRGWQQLQRQGVTAADVLAIRTDLRPTMLPGGYWAQRLLAELPEVPVGYDLPYGPRFDHRAADVRTLAGRRGTPFNRVPFPVAVAPAPVESAQALAGRLAAVFGADGVCRFDPDAVAAADLPAAVAGPLLEVGLPRRVEGFFAVHHPAADGVAEAAGPVLPDVAALVEALGRGARATAAARAALLGQLLLGSDGWALITVDTAQGRVRAIDPDDCAARHCNADLTAFLRSLLLFAERYPRLRDLPPAAAGPAVAELQWALATLDATAFADPENWWAVIVEQLWHGVL